MSKTLHLNNWFACNKLVVVMKGVSQQLIACNKLVVVMKGVSQQLIACNKLVVVMKGVFWWGGSQEVARPITTAWLKMEDSCILCIAIEFFSRKRIIKTKRGRPYNLFKLQITLAQSCKNIWTYLCKHSNISNVERRNWLMGC
jgi:hypothetical protein